MSAPLRGVCQELAEVVAARLFRRDAEHRATGFLQARNRADMLADALSESPDLVSGIERRAQMLLSWFDCTALLGRIHGKPVRCGTDATPPPQTFWRPVNSHAPKADLPISNGCRKRPKIT